MHIFLCPCAQNKRIFYPHLSISICSDMPNTGKFVLIQAPYIYNLFQIYLFEIRISWSKFQTQTIIILIIIIVRIVSPVLKHNIPFFFVVTTMYYNIIELRSTFHYHTYLKYKLVFIDDSSMFVAFMSVFIAVLFYAHICGHRWVY